MSDQSIIALLMMLSGVVVVIFARAFSEYRRPSASWMFGEATPQQIQTGTFVFRLVGIAVILARVYWFLR